MATRHAEHVHFEQLECRQLLSGAAAAPAEALLAAGFAPIVWQERETFAAPGRWIAQVEGLHGKAGEQLAKVRQMLAAKGHADIRAIQHLGADGLVLLDAPAGMTHGQLKSALHGMNVRYIEPDFAVWTAATTPNDPSFSSQWALDNTGQTGGTPDADIDAPEAWDITRGDGSIVVGVIDSGIDYTHPDLASNIWGNPGEIAGNGIDDDGNGFIDDVHGWDFVNNDNDPTDDRSHGTHVAGTIAAAGNNGVGVTGVAWNAKLMALKTLDSAGSGTTSAAVAAVNYVTMMRTTEGVNVRLTSNSWGGAPYSTALYDAIRDGGNAGMLFIAAAGNAASDTDLAPFYPAGYEIPSVISVGATEFDDQLRATSNYGVNSVYVFAPGGSILSTVPGGGYALKSGTSMAAPHVSGAAVLAWSLNPAATLEGVRNAIFRGVDQLPWLVGKAGSGGRLNAYNALVQLTTTPTATPVAVAGLTATTTAGGINLTWSHPANDEDGFHILRSTNGVNFVQVGAASILASRFSDTTAAAGTTYHYTVVAFNAVGDAPASNVASATTLPASSTPAAPTNLTATATSPTRVVLNWTDNSNNESGFKIERSTNLVKWTQLGSVGANVTTFADTKVKKSTAYIYRVRAYNATAASAYSNEARVTTPASAAATAAGTSAASTPSSASDSLSTRPAEATMRPLFSATAIEWAPLIDPLLDPRAESLLE